jgi:hypothetical protein
VPGPTPQWVLWATASEADDLGSHAAPRDDARLRPSLAPRGIFHPPRLTAPLPTC